MYLLDLDDINSSDLKATLEQAATEESAIEIKGGTDNLKQLRTIILLLGLLPFDTLKLSITTPATLKHDCYGLNALTANIKTLYLHDVILGDILDNAHKPGYKQAKLRLDQLEQLIIIDANNNHLTYVGSEVIKAFLNQKKEPEKTYFKPDINTLQSIPALISPNIGKLIASIPDEQTELDLSDIDITIIPFDICQFLLFSKLPAHIHTLKLARVNFHSLTLSYFPVFSQFLQKFTTIYLSATDIDPLLSGVADIDKEDALTVHYKIEHLIEGTTNASIHILQHDNTERMYTSYEFKKELQRRDPIFQLHQQANAPFKHVSQHLYESNNRKVAHIRAQRQQLIEQLQQANAPFKHVSQHLHERHNRKVTNVTTQRQQLIEQLQQEIRHFEDAGQSCFGINNLKKAARLQQALNRATGASIATQDLLTYRDDGAESILDALAYHRIGFFGKPNSLARIEAYVERQGLGMHTS